MRHKRNRHGANEPKTAHSGSGHMTLVLIGATRRACSMNRPGLNGITTKTSADCFSLAGEPKNGRTFSGFTFDCGERVLAIQAGVLALASMGEAAGQNRGAGVSGGEQAESGRRLSPGRSATLYPN